VGGRVWVWTIVQIVGDAALQRKAGALADRDRLSHRLDQGLADIASEAGGRDPERQDSGVVLSFGLGCSGCASSPSAESLSDCMEGSLRLRIEPECSESDCRVLSLEKYDAVGMTSIGVRHSPAAGTSSSFGRTNVIEDTLEEGPVTGEGTFRRDTGTSPIRCHGNSMRRDFPDADRLSDAAGSGVVEALGDAGSFSSKPIRW